MANQVKKETNLGEGSVGRLLFNLAVPAIAAQLINVLYNMVDRMYIGHIPEVGATALTGVGVCLPVIMIISAFAALIGSGGAPRAAIMMGRGDNDSAEEIMGNCISTLTILALILTAVFLFFGRSILMIFGASDVTISYALDYMNIYAIGTIAVQYALGLNPFITTQGFAKTSMLTVAIGAVINIILDPILIFGFNMGVKGAALATIISQAVSAVWVVWFLCGKKSILKVRKKHLHVRAGVILPVLALGVSPFIMQSTESLLAVCFNTSLLKYGSDLAVGSMTILTSVMQFAMLPLLGMTQGAQPIISYNYGAGKADRVKKAFHLLFISCLAYTTLLWALVMINPAMFAAIFTNNAQLIEMTSWTLRIYMAVSCILGAQIACQQTFIALGNAKASLFLALLRKIILLIPLIYIMPSIFSSDKVKAVFLAEPIADTIAITVTVIMFFATFNKTLKKLPSHHPEGEN
ncbi:MATE family efflux transporter [Anaerolentibacter hominis]|uniref:MATE family efflux transporter n=1 Tax=Anaerolentibacter hominis TaxID=3079009 RepID=UPI0031B7F6BC